MLSDFTITVKDIVDILMVAAIMFGFYRLLRRSGAQNLFWGIMIFVVAWFVVSGIFRLEMTGALFDMVISVGALALIVIFQDELRGFMYRLGARMQFSFLRNLFSSRNRSEELYVREIEKACLQMSDNKTGALIVIAGNVALAEYTETGQRLGAEVSARLIENLFFKNTPLHDGALIVSHGRLEAAACILPVSKATNIPQHYGLRHRAALGIAEKTDALALVVSEETGRISAAQNGEIREIKAEDIFPILSAFVH